MVRTPRTALLGAFACLVGLGITGLLAYLSPVARFSDSATLQGFVGLRRARLTPVIDQVAHLADPLPYALIGLGLAAVAVARRRPRVAGAIFALLLLTGLTTQTLKPLLAHPRYQDWLAEGQIAAASWPSGHATASMTLALCGILAVPARWRPTAAVVGAAFAISVSYAILVLGWHFPSDVLGGYLVAMTWTLLAVAALLAADRRRPARRRAEARPRPVDALAPLALGAGAASMAAAVAIARPGAVRDYAAAHTTFAVGAAVIGALAVALALGFARAIRA
jgi:membrane-associated phospholipid phosphatase